MRAVPPSEDFSISCDDTLVDPETDEISPAKRPEKSSKGQNQPSLRSDQASPSKTNHASYQSPKPSEPTSEAVQKPDASDHLQAKDASRNQKKREGKIANQARNFRSSRLNPLPPEGDLLQMLICRHRENGQKHEILQQALKVKEMEYRELYAASEDLYGRFTEISQRCNERDAELVKFKEARPKWEEKIKKLNDYIKGLTNDHNRLRDDTKDIKNRQISILKDKEAIFDTLREVGKASEEKFLKSKELLAEARHDLETAKQTIDDQMTQQRQQNSLLSSEQERSDRLEEEVSKFTTNQAQLLKIFTEHGEAVATQLTELLQKSEQVQAIPSIAPIEDLRPMMEHCISVLQKLPITNDLSHKADMQKLDDSVHGYLDE